MVDSIFGPPDAERRRWQLRNLATLAELLKIGGIGKLPPLDWTVPAVGAPTGHVLYRHGAAHPREQFEAWVTAVSKDTRVRPRGLGIGGLGEPRSERAMDGGKTWLMAGFELQLPRWADFVISASWYEDEFVAVTGPKAGA